MHFNNVACRFFLEAKFESAVLLFLHDKHYKLKDRILWYLWSCLSSHLYRFMPFGWFCSVESSILFGYLLSSSCVYVVIIHFRWPVEIKFYSPGIPSISFANLRWFHNKSKLFVALWHVFMIFISFAHFFCLCFWGLTKFNTIVCHSIETDKMFRTWWTIYKLLFELAVISLTKETKNIPNLWVAVIIAD